MRVQSKVIDVIGPLGKMWSILDILRVEEEQGEELDLVEKTITLLGQVNVAMVCNRKRNILF